MPARSGGDVAEPSLIDRRRARAWALQVHYRWESEGRRRPLGEVLDDTLVGRRVSPRRIPLIRRLVEALEAHLEEIDERLVECLENWELERVASIDRGILRLGAAELLFVPGIPPRVAIQEAIRVAEAYGGPRSPAFVNGVLDALMHTQAGAGGG